MIYHTRRVIANLFKSSGIIYQISMISAAGGEFIQSRSIGIVMQRAPPPARGSSLPGKAATKRS